MSERIITEDALNRFDYVITLEQRVFGDYPHNYTRRYRWRRSDGVVVSPELETAEAARDYPKTHGFIPQQT